MPEISVVVPAYNAERSLDRCVRSILAQTYKDFELLLVDDGSHDRTPEICDAFAQKDRRVRVLHQPNRGIAATRNALVRGARGRYICPVDADDWVEPGYLSALMRLCGETGVPLACCNHWLDAPHRSTPCFVSPAQVTVLEAKTACDSLLYHGVPDVSAWGKIYLRDLLAQFEYPEGRLYEDTWLFADILLQAKKIAYTPTPLYHYCLDEGSICRSEYHPGRMDYLAAVEHMTSSILRVYPELKPGCRRRKMHAALSVRRYLIHCPPACRPQRRRLDGWVRAHAVLFLGDMRAPLRDKLGCILACLGPFFFDNAWLLYEKRRSDR